MPKILNTIGLAANLVGVILLFRYGMPYRHTGSFLLLSGDAVTDKDRRLDDRYRTLGWIGLVLIIIGTGLQIASTVSGE